MKNQRNLQKQFQLADTITSETETYTVELLVGNDHYYKIILDERKNIKKTLHGEVKIAMGSIWKKQQRNLFLVIMSKTN